HDHVPDAVTDLGEGARRVARFAHNRALQALRENRAYAATDDRVVVHQQDPDHCRCRRVTLRRRRGPIPSGGPALSGTRTVMSVPFPRRRAMTNVPPTRAARSRIPRSPVARGSASWASVTPH